jgi:hypothetical protein
VPKVEHGDGTIVVAVATPVFLRNSVMLVFRFVLAITVLTLVLLDLLVVSSRINSVGVLIDPGQVLA